MKKQVLYMFFVILFSNICKSMDNNDAFNHLLSVLRSGDEPIYSDKIQLPSPQVIDQHLNNEFSHLQVDVKKEISQKLGDKYTSKRAIRYCSEYIIKGDPAYKALTLDKQFTLLNTITNQITSLALSSSSSSSDSSSSQWTSLPSFSSSSSSS